MRSIIKGVYIAAVCLASFASQANSVSVEVSAGSSGRPGDVLTVSINYDFTDYAMFGGGMDLIYDPSILELVSYTQADLQPDAQLAASPVGQLEFPGLYAGFGVGTFAFFNGITSAGSIGEFSFNIIGDSTSADFAGCGGTEPHDYHHFDGLVCITPNAINPFVSLAGEVVDAELFTGPGTYIPPNPVPVPAAFWLFLTAVGVIAGVGRKR